MPDKFICTGCSALSSTELGGTKLFPKTWVVNYCKQYGKDAEVAFIKRGIPYTPEWCPALNQKTNNQIKPDR